MKKKFNAAALKNPYKSAFIGFIIIIFSFIALSLIFTAILYNTSDPTSKSELLSLCAFVLSGAIGAFVNARILGGGIAAALPSALALLAFFSISAVCSGGISLGSFMSALCFSFATIFALFLANRKKRANRFYHRRR